MRLGPVLHLQLQVCHSDSGTPPAEELHSALHRLNRLWSSSLLEAPFPLILADRCSAKLIYVGKVSQDCTHGRLQRHDTFCCRPAADSFNKGNALSPAYIKRSDGLTFLQSMRLHFQIQGGIHGILQPDSKLLRRYVSRKDSHAEKPLSVNHPTAAIVRCTATHLR